MPRPKSRSPLPVPGYVVKVGFDGGRRLGVGVSVAARSPPRLRAPGGQAAPRCRPLDVLRHGAECAAPPVRRRYGAHPFRIVLAAFSITVVIESEKRLRSGSRSRLSRSRSLSRSAFLYASARVGGSPEKSTPHTSRALLRHISARRFRLSACRRSYFCENRSRSSSAFAKSGPTGPKNLCSCFCTKASQVFFALLACPLTRMRAASVN